jgi:hypothetical protein
MRTEEIRIATGQTETKFSCKGKEERKGSSSWASNQDGHLEEEAGNRSKKGNSTLQGRRGSTPAESAPADSEAVVSVMFCKLNDEG